MKNKTLSYNEIQVRSFIIYSCLVCKVKLDKIMVIDRLMEQSKIPVPENEREYIDYLEKIFNRVKLNKRLVNKIKKELYLQLKKGDLNSVRVWYRQFKKIMNKSRHFKN
jgi:hypothetical protein